MSENALVPASPVTEVVTDDVEAAVSFIVKAVQALERSALDTAVRVGTYVNERFDEDSPSLRALVADPRLSDVGVSKSTLNNWARVAALHKAYPQEVGERLGLTAQIRLLAAPDDVREAIAVRAAKDRWSSVRIAQAVAEARMREAEERRKVAAAAGKAVPGRPRLPVALKRVRVLQKAAEALTSDWDWGGLDEAAIGEASAALEWVEVWVADARKGLAEAREVASEG